jgi:hypothetical protein
MSNRLQIHLRTQTDIVDELEADFDDSSNYKWTVSQFIRGVNRRLRRWIEKVLVPHLYTLSDGLVAGTFEYTLPDYVDGKFELQVKSSVGYYSTTVNQENRIWSTMTGWEVYPNAAGGRILRLDFNPSNTDARLIYWSPNSLLPVGDSLMQLSAGIDTDDTSLTLSTKKEIGRSGYVKINAEFISYAGVTEGSSTLTLTNLVRGLAGTTAGTHNTSANVNFCVGVHSLRLFNHLQYEAGAYLHGIYLDRAGQTARDHHEYQQRLYMQMANDAFRLIVSPRPVRLKVRRKTIGPIIGEVGWSFAPG